MKGGSLAARAGFSKEVVLVLAQRVNYICSNPHCNDPTAGPHTDPSRSVIEGEAAHISGAKKTSARFDPDMNPEVRHSAANGIYLCCKCHKRIDRDSKKYPAFLLHKWKQDAEDRADRAKARIRDASAGTHAAGPAATDLVQLGGPRFHYLCKRLTQKESLRLGIGGLDAKKRAAMDQDSIQNWQKLIESETPEARIATRLPPCFVWIGEFTVDPNLSKEAILASIAACRTLSHHEVQRLILFLPVDPDDAFLEWLGAVAPEEWAPQVYGATKILDVLRNEDQDIEEEVLHETLLQRGRFAIGHLKLVRFRLDKACAWHHKAGRALYFRGNQGSDVQDIAFDLIVENAGSTRAALLAVHAEVGDWRAQSHGVQGTPFLYPKRTYAVSIEGGSAGTYQSDCDPPLLIYAGAQERFKVSVRDTGYSWTGTIVVTLDFGLQRRLRLPMFRVWR